MKTMKPLVNILDCTLRDGGYANNWEFCRSQVIKITRSLDKSNIDIIELGYLNNQGKSNNSTLFNSIYAVDSVLNGLDINAQVVLMINLFDFDVDELPVCSKTKINGIRLAFHKKDKDKALLQAKKIIALGYKLFFQPMVTKNYQDDELLSLMQKTNKLGVYAFYIVDSFGSMSLEEFRKYVNLFDSNLNSCVKLGYHSHNNMQLAFSNAINLCDSGIDREVILDSSIYGMGRGAGNLNTELIADYIGNKYEVMPLLETIDEILIYYFKKHPWGFSPAQYLSASLDCHPNYTSYLINKKTNHIADIHSILEKIPLDCRNNFDESIVNSLYEEFLLTDKSKSKGRLKISGKKALLIASGRSSNDNVEAIEQKIGSKNYLVIALNHKPQFTCDYYFFSNQQRFDEFKDCIPLERQVITTNIRCEENISVVIQLKDIAYIKGEFVTNVAILMINYLVLQKNKKVEIAGLDGYQIGKNNYAYDETSVITSEDLFESLNQAVNNSLQILRKVIELDFITDSIYSKEIPLRVIGIIPARYNSSRFQGKPLCLINNIPMIKRTYEQAKKSKALNKLVVATDSLEIENYCKQENIPVLMTSAQHSTGTDRLSEVSKNENFDFYINIQGDEPVIDSQSISQIVNDFQKHTSAYEVYSLYKKIDDLDEIESNTIVKVVVNSNNELIYMSRYPIPFNKSEKKITYNKQVCVYGFTKKALAIFSDRDKTHNEQFEDIELLRFLDLGYSVKMTETAVDSISVDVPSDVKKVEDFLNKNKLD
jgi:3-deoxy-D-manno-octulosonate cytidylyltransferase